MLKLPFSIFSRLPMQISLIRLWLYAWFFFFLVYCLRFKTEVILGPHCSASLPLSVMLALQMRAWWKGHGFEKCTLKKKMIGVLALVQIFLWQRRLSFLPRSNPSPFTIAKMLAHTHSQTSPCLILRIGSWQTITQPSPKIITPHKYSECQSTKSPYSPLLKYFALPLCNRSGFSALRNSLLGKKILLNIIWNDSLKAWLEFTSPVFETVYVPFVYSSKWF